MARLVSVNVGLPRNITSRGETVRTAIWKRPDEGRRRPGGIGILPNEFFASDL